MDILDQTIKRLEDEPWRVEAIGELGEIKNLCLDADFSKESLCQRLTGLVEYFTLAAPDSAAEAHYTLIALGATTTHERGRPQEDSPRDGDQD